MEKLKNISSITLLLLLFFSCSPTGESPTNIIPDNDDDYLYDEIEYTVVENSVRHYSIELPDIEFLNGGDVPQEYLYNPLENFKYETSQFFPNTSDNFIIKDFWISIPLYIDENEISLGRKDWKYSIDIERKNSELNLSKKYEIPPRQKLVIKSDLVFVEYTTKYRLTIIGEQSKEKKIIEGEWIGNYPVNAEIETVFSNL